MFHDSDPVSGFELRAKYPLVADWVERVNGTNAISARTYGQNLWRVDGQTGVVSADRSNSPCASEFRAWVFGCSFLTPP
eukprot:COSAG02_NODE_4967_length_4773_cov_44.423834_9_plen_79_part_00